MGDENGSRLLCVDLGGVNISKKIDLFDTVVPKKVKLALDRLGITNVVGGYSTMVQRWKNGVHEYRAAYTCWNGDDEVVIVLYKGKDDPDWCTE